MNFVFDYFQSDNTILEFMRERLELPKSNTKRNNKFIMNINAYFNEENNINEDDMAIIYLLH